MVDEWFSQTIGVHNRSDLAIRPPAQPYLSRLVCGEAAQLLRMRAITRAANCARGLSEHQKQNNRLLPRNPDNIYVCIHLCGRTFHRKSDWERHLKGDVTPEGWLCDLGKIWRDGLIMKCTLCDQINPDENHWHLVHGRRQSCFEKPLNTCRGGRVFSRRDKMRDHLTQVHGHLNADLILDSWKFLVPENFFRQCGFCGQEFSSWNSSINHIAEHFRQGTTMVSWRKRDDAPPPGESSNHIAVNGDDEDDGYNGPCNDRDSHDHDPPCPPPGPSTSGTGGSGVMPSATSSTGKHTGRHSGCTRFSTWFFRSSHALVWLPRNAV
jgi:hypothetical protein